MIAPPATTLTLIGTVHRDPAGEERLLACLRRLRPDVITLEMSEKALAYRLGEARRQMERLDLILERLAGTTGEALQKLQGHPAVRDIRVLLDLPFEYRAAAAWAAEAAVPLNLIDRSDISAAKLRRVETELITYRNLRVLVTLPAEAGKSRAEGLAAARALIDREAGEAFRRAFLEGKRGVEGIGQRDREMAERIRALLAEMGNGHLAHIGGWVHLVEDERRETLFSLLQDLHPRKVLLG